jgi:hypothetical protein
MALAGLVLVAAACAQPTSRAASARRDKPSPAAAPLAAYGAVIHSVDAASPALRAAVSDAADVLGRVTGVPFAVTEETASKGIILMRSTSSEAAESDVSRLKGRGPEAFVIRSAETTRLTITANADAGLVNGLYSYLQRIGCRWFFPNDAWTVLPKRRDVTLQVDALVAPAFRMRLFSGTGGFGGATPVDPERRMSVRWDTWKRRNGFGGEFMLGGHSYEAFNVAQRAVLEAHPEYLALVAGKRRPWAPTTKLCVSNPNLAALYTESRLALLRQQVKAAPDGPRAFAVSVDPSDGGGFCECEKCRGIGSGSASDQAFHLANQVAKAVAKEMPGRRVNLYAYMDHAAVPTISLEPNVYVSVVPEAFQRTGLSPEELIAAWRQKVGPLSLYTYWSIPDWTGDLPNFDFTVTPREKIRYWHEHGIEGVAFETTYSAGAMGIGLYLASRLLWNPATDDAALLREFYELAFGPSQASMQRMLERWAKDFTLSDYEIGLSARDLAEARKAAAGDAAVLRRIADYDAYLEFIAQWLAYQDAPKKTPERIEQARAVMATAYRQYDSAMIHAHRIQQLIADRYEKGSSLRAEFDPKVADAPGWKMLSLPSSAKRLEARYPAVALPRVRVAEKLVSRQASSRALVGAAEAQPMLFGGSTDFEIEVPNGVGSLELKIKVQKNPAMPGNKVIVRRAGGAIVHREIVPADGEEHTLAIPLEAAGRYVVRVEDQKTTFFFTPPAGLPTIFRKFASPWLSPPLYFLVPKGLRRAAIFAHGARPIEIRDADGRLVSTHGRRVVMFDVPPGQDGRVWSFRNYKGWEQVRMLNLPQVFALSPDALLVPAGSELR